MRWSQRILLEAQSLKDVSAEFHQETTGSFTIATTHTQVKDPGVMKLQQFRTIVEVSRQNLNLSKAAQTLYISQPALSKQILQLEDELGITIFVRSGKRFVGITPPGREVLAIAERILLEAQSLKDVSAEFHQETTGSFTIATTHTQDAGHWFVREVTGLLRRTLARLDVSSRTLFALIEPGSCFTGTLAELAFAADRVYMAVLPDTPERAPRIALSELNFGAIPWSTDSRASVAASTRRPSLARPRARWSASRSNDAGHWFVREVTGLLRRTLARLDVSSRTLFALIEPMASCTFFSKASSSAGPND
ncbi:LysR family transcriptional regulator [Mycobacterium tuberculosis]|uniref:LysR family transcriptional regulator n=1 Tax=Mycobacterium tuberculosis TaxID=1773 RepID=UPI00272AF37E|nr:LysR family transcriptional regulator [Mycobacterium tuberculosis]